MLPYNSSEKYLSRYESNTPLVRTGTVSTSPLKSLCNSLLYCCSKKFIANEEEDRLNMIDTLELDFQLLYREGEIFESFYKQVFSMMETLLKEFYDFISNTNKKVEDESLLMVLLVDVFSSRDSDSSEMIEDSEKVSPKTIITNFNFIQNKIFTASDIKKITRLLIQKKFSSLDDMKTSLMKDVKHFLKFQDSVNDGSENSTKYKIHIMDLMGKLFDVSVSSFEIPNFFPDRMNKTFYDLAQEKFDCNLFILNKNEDVQYSSKYDKKKKSIILISYDDINFDIVGKLRDKVITRQFFPYEEIIKSILYHYGNHT